MSNLSYKHFPIVVATCFIVLAHVVSITSCKQQIVTATSDELGYALLDAVKHGDDRLAASLLGEGANIDIRDEHGETPLLQAIRNNNIRVAKMFLNAGVDHTIHTEKGKGPIELAIHTGSEEMVVNLLAGGVSPGEGDDARGELMLRAIRLRYFRVAQIMLEHGANPDVAEAGGQTALHITALERLPNYMDMFIEAGANTELKDEEGATALWYALRKRKEQQDESGNVERLLKAGADASASGPGQMTLLGEAVRRGTYQDVLQLLKYGANVNAEGGGHNQCPVKMATATRAVKILKLLLTSGADSRDVFNLAVKEGDISLLQLLLNLGVSYDDWNGEGEDSLAAYCVRIGDLDMLDFLLSRGVDPGAKGIEGDHPLHMGIAMRDLKAVAVVLAYGHDPNLKFAHPVSGDFLALTQKESTRWFLKNDYRLTTLMMAANNGDIEIIKSLMDHSAWKVVRSGKFKLYPINFASRRADIKAMQVMLGQNPEKEKIHAVLDLSDQRMKLYNSEEKVIFSSRVSTGKKGSRTPTGEFVITDKHKEHTSNLYDSSMPYFQRFSDSAIGFHAGRCPGYPASHGCVRMPHSAAKKLFKLTPVGTRVVMLVLCLPEPFSKLRIAASDRYHPCRELTLF